MGKMRRPAPDGDGVCGASVKFLAFQLIYLQSYLQVGAQRVGSFSSLLFSCFPQMYVEQHQFIIAWSQDKSVCKMCFTRQQSFKRTSLVDGMVNN